MKITVAGMRAREPFDGADYVIVSGACPFCGEQPFNAQGTGRNQVEGYDTISEIARFCADG